MKQIFILAMAVVFTLTSCTANELAMETPYVIEITTFSYKSDVKADVFWTRDAEIQADYTGKQPGFIKRESGLSEDNEVVVVVYWETENDAEASMQKFMQDSSVADYASMIDGPTMNMKRYMVR